MINFFLFLIFSTSLLAAPKEVEVWFLSHAKTAQLESLLNLQEIRFGSRTAELQCQEMGDYCFDPQFGLYKKDDAGLEMVDSGKLNTESTTIPSAKSVERNLIDCDPKNYFDVFCGKAQKEKSTSVSQLEVWVDTSSSMREFDYSEKDGSCHRKSLIKALDGSCGFNDKMNVMMFDTSIKQAGTMDQLCQNQGLNEYKKLMDWIERSDAKKLIIITDIYEFHKEFSDYIESIHGKLRGDKDPLTAKEMVNLAGELAKSCK